MRADNGELKLIRVQPQQHLQLPQRLQHGDMPDDFLPKELELRTLKIVHGWLAPSGGS